MQALEQAILEMATAWEQDGIAHGETRPIIGAVDETFLERMLLVFMDLASGYLLLEEAAEDRTYDTWYARVKARLDLLGVDVLYFDCRASDGTTPASRFFRRDFPDLFETVLSHIEELPRPRRRNQTIALSG
jgi:Family of unknown function (DUF6399)